MVSGLVAEHRRCWAKNQTLTDPVHADAAVILRRRTTQTASWQTAANEVEVRSLSDYDAVFGLDELTDDQPEAVARWQPAKPSRRRRPEMSTPSWPT